MRKLMSLLTSITLLAGTSSNLVSCNTDKFDQFQNAINAGQSFIYYIGASDCTECTKLDQAYWNNNSGDPTQQNGGGILNPAVWSNIMKSSYAQGVKQRHSALYKSLLNMKFYSDTIDKQSNVFDDKGVKQILHKVADIFDTKNIPALNPYSEDGDDDYIKNYLKINTTPLMIYFINGQLAGVQQATPIEVGATPRKNDTAQHFFNNLADLLTGHADYLAHPFYPGESK